MGTYTIALATRLKRKVFTAGNISKDVLEKAEDVFAESGVLLKDHRFYDYGVAFCVECRDRDEALGTADRIRKATSRPIRQMYQELWRMPSLWNQTPFVAEGNLGEENLKRIDKYYDGLKSR